MKQFPKRLYEVTYNGILFMRFYKDDSAIKENGYTHEIECHYKIISCIEMPSERGWVLSDIEKKMREWTCGFNPLSLEYINKILENKNMTFWTLDFEKACKVSKERFERYFPTGKSWDVIKTWDDYGRNVINDKPMLKEEADKLADELNAKLRTGSFSSYKVCVHRG